MTRKKIVRARKRYNAYRRSCMQGCDRWLGEPRVLDHILGPLLVLRGDDLSPHPEFVGVLNSLSYGFQREQHVQDVRIWGRAKT